MDARFRIALAAAVDVVLVACFVAIGRASHREDQSAFLVTFWPFAVGLAVGWLAGRCWRAPFAAARTGVPAWLGTVVVGMLLRAASGQGVQVAFVVVASIVVAAFVIGWRALLLAVQRSSTRDRDQSGPIGRVLGRR